MNAYKHTQRGNLILIVMGFLSVAFIIVGFTVARSVLAVVPLLLLCGWLFYSLTIEIGDGELRWRFGPGLIRNRIPLQEIASATPVRTSALEGWGIHFSRFGWLYNVSGCDAVAITLKNGKKFALGTDEPQTLVTRLHGTA